jgi:fatty-acyl-CoA synthase
MLTARSPGVDGCLWLGCGTGVEVAAAGANRHDGPSGRACRVYPREIEEFLYSHPQIKDVQIVGVPDARYGEEIAAFVITRTSDPIDAEAVHEFCRGKIAHYKIPRYVISVDEFPMTITGKIQKFKLRQQAIEWLDLQSAILETA